MARLIMLAAVIALGLTAGAMLAEGAVLVPYWRALPADDFLRWYRDNGARLVDFYGPLEIAATALVVVAAILARGGLLIVSALLAVAVLVTYPVYFRDVNARFASGTIATGDVAGELARWAAWHWARTAVGIGAFAAALLAARKGGT